MKVKRIGILGIVLLLCMSFLSFPFILAKEDGKRALPTDQEEQRKIKVGYILSEGFAEVDDKGIYSGYAYDYLNEIAKYTGWTYEFIPVALTNEKIMDVMERTQKGEIDILMGILKNEDTMKQYAFPEFNCGTTYTTLITMADNKEISESDFSSYNGIRVGYSKTATSRLKRLESYANTNGFTFVPVPYDIKDDIRGELQKGKVDAILLGDLQNTEDTKNIARFGAQPYYFAVSKKSQDVVGKMNMAISRIKEVDTHFDEVLYNKHFPMNTKTELVLSESEKNYIQNLGVVKVASVINSKPIEYFEDGEFHGATAKMFEKITKGTGIKFDFIEAKNIEEAYRMVDEGKADIVTGIYSNSLDEIKEGYTTFSPYVNLPMMLVKSREMKIPDPTKDILAVAGTNVLMKGWDRSKTKQFNTIEDCLLAVEKGEVDYTYVNSYSVDYYKRKHMLEKIDTVALTSENRSISFAVNQPVDPNFVTIVNKAIRHINQDESQSLLFESVSNLDYELTPEAFIRYYIVEILLVIFLIGAFIISIIIYFRKNKQKLEKASDKRYRVMSVLTGEMLFEYDVKKDRLMFSDEGTKVVGIESAILSFIKRQQTNELEIDVEQAMQNDVDMIETRNAQIKVYEKQIEQLDGSFVWFEISIVTMLDDNGKVEVFLGKLRNIDKEVHEKTKLLDQAQKDSLTNIYNKGTTEININEHLMQQHNNTIEHAFLIIDIDNFKVVNDSYGHLCGDETLKKIASIISEPFSEVDAIVGRIGGDEFIVFLKSIPNHEYAQSKASEMIKLIESIDHINEHEVHISCSIGISYSPRNGVQFAQLYDKADTALYTAKKNGKKGFCVYLD